MWDAAGRGTNCNVRGGRGKINLNAAGERTVDRAKQREGWEKGQKCVGVESVEYAVCREEGEEDWVWIS